MLPEDILTAKSPEEIKAILEFPGIHASVNTAALPQYLSFLWVPAPGTLFEGICIL